MGKTVLHVCKQLEPRPACAAAWLIKYYIVSFKILQVKLPDLPKYLDNQPWANSVDPDQMPQIVASDQGLHCLPFIQQFLNTSAGSENDLLKF